jgi:hypothetical protein
MDVSAENKSLTDVKIAAEKKVTLSNKLQRIANKSRRPADKNKIMPFRPRPTLVVDVLPESDSKHTV